VVPVWLARVAEIVAVPVLTPVAKPVLLIVAIAVLLEVQLTRLVTFPALEPSENVAVAMNCCWVPLVIVGFCGEIVMVLIDFAATVIGTPVALTLPDFALIVVVPNVVPLGKVAAAVARPEELTVAMVVEDEDQVTCVVTSPVELSPNVAIAVNC
jgi:hypothetical protein